MATGAKRKAKGGELGRANSRRNSRTVGTGSSLADQLLASMSEISASLDAGEPPEKRFTVRTWRIALEPGEYPPAKVRATRDLLNLSQPLFAMFLGVDSATVRSWEQGKRPPAPIARRFMDEINLHPDFWRGRVAQAVKVETEGPTG